MYVPEECPPSRFRRLFPGSRAVLPALQALRRLVLLEERGGRLHLADRGFDRQGQGAVDRDATSARSPPTAGNHRCGSGGGVRYPW